MTIFIQPIKKEPVARRGKPSCNRLVVRVTTVRANVSLLLCAAYSYLMLQLVFVFSIMLAAKIVDDR